MSPASNDVFCTVVVLTSLAGVMAVYIAFSRRCGNFINALTPFVLIPVPAYFLLELVNIYLFGYSGSNYAYLYVYVTYFLGMLVKAIAFLATPSPRYSPLIRIPVLKVPGPGAAFAFMALGCALYAPVLIEHSDLLAHPRQIYTITRTGYGIESFLSAFCVYVGYILLLFEKSRGWALRAVYLLIAVPVLYLHGSKGQVFALFLMWLYFLAFVERRRFNFGRLVMVSLGVVALMLTLFYLTFPGSLREDLIESIAGYSSEYTRNAVLVIDDTDLAPQFGRIALEDNFYSFIPRQLFPEKRKDFGVLWLASRYYPARFQRESGAPAFGLGVEYADFGVFAVFYYVVVQALLGAAIRIFADRLKTWPDPGSFLFLLVLLDVPLIPTGTGFPLPLYYALGLLVKCIGGRVETAGSWRGQAVAG